MKATACAVMFAAIWHTPKDILANMSWFGQSSAVVMLILSMLGFFGFLLWSEE